MRMKIRPVKLTDSVQLVTIYNYYVLQTTSSFEVEAISELQMAQRISEITSAYPYLIAENQEGEIVGYCHAKPFGKTIGYQYSVEVTVYLTPNVKQQGIGTLLYQALEKDLQKKGIKTLIASITAENQESLTFHKKRGYEKAAHLKMVGYKFDRWLDVIWLQKILLQF